MIEFPKGSGSFYMGEKQTVELKAQPMGGDEEAAWFAGRLPRRLLAIPFGGPIPSPKSRRGVDLDNEWFDETTDIFGSGPVGDALRATRERYVDFQHSYRPPSPRFGDDSGMMRGHLIGKSILDPDPLEDGWWVELWFDRGNRRVAMVEALAKRGAQLFGSSQPIGKARVEPNGHIAVWPYWMQTITTAPQNTLSVIRPKAALDVVEGWLEQGGNWTRIEEAMRNLGSDLRSTSLPGGEDGAKAGRVLSAVNESDLQEAMTAVQGAMERLAAVVSRQTKSTEETVA